MSADATKAFESSCAQLRRKIADLQMSADRRPSAAAVDLVGRRLAFRYDPTRRGYVDETIDQLCDALPALSRSQVLRALPALDALGLWVVTRRGGSRDGYASRRIPGPELCATAHRLGLDLSTPQTALDLSAVARSDAEDLSAVPRSDMAADVVDNQELSAVARSDDPGTQRGTARNSARYRADLSAVPRTSKRETSKKNDDDARSAPASSSSSEIFTTARTAARRVAAAKGRTDTAYVQGILKIWRTEHDVDGLTRFAKLEIYEKVGMPIERQIELVMRDATIAESTWTAAS